MSDTSMSMSDDDRQRLVKVRLEEYMSEFLNSDAGRKWFDERVKELAAAAPLAPSPPPQSPARPSHAPSSRVSAFEKYVLGR